MYEYMHLAQRTALGTCTRTRTRTRPYPPVPAGMGRVRVQLKLNAWVRMGAHIYYTMASRAPGGLMASAKLGLGLKTPETIHNQRVDVFTIEP
jgi:hypothetical protein